MPRFQPRFFPSTKISNWSSGAFGSGDAAVPITASGGTTNTYEGFKSHKFTASGTFTVSDGAGEVEVMIIAGGGGGGNKDNDEESGGGGGAGGMCVGSLYCEAGDYVVTIGAGGARGSPSGSNHTDMPRNGSDSRVGIAFAIGGGFGGSTNYGTLDINGDRPRDGGVGGSGGGGTSNQYGGNVVGTGGDPIAGQGYHGGATGGYSGSTYMGHSTGGGGGAGAVGQTQYGTGGAVGTGRGGNGGAGATNDYETGSNQTYAGGGGGCGAGINSTYAVAGTGGSGGGGNGATRLSWGGTRVTGSAGTANTGGGGGGGSGGGGTSGTGHGGAGGSGIVVIRYAA